MNDRMTSNRLMVSSFPTTSFSLVGLYFSILQCTEEYGENTGHAAKYGYSRYQGSSCVAFLAGFEVSADFEALPSPAAAEESSIGSSPSSAIFSREVRGLPRYAHARDDCEHAKTWPLARNRRTSEQEEESLLDMAGLSGRLLLLGVAVALCLGCSGIPDNSSTDCKQRIPTHTL